MTPINYILISIALILSCIYFWVEKIKRTSIEEPLDEYLSLNGRILYPPKSYQKKKLLTEAKDLHETVKDANTNPVAPKSGDIITEEGNSSEAVENSCKAEDSVAQETAISDDSRTLDTQKHVTSDPSSEEKTTNKTEETQFVPQKGSASNESEKEGFKNSASEDVRDLMADTNDNKAVEIPTSSKIEKTKLMKEVTNVLKKRKKGLVVDNCSTKEVEEKKVKNKDDADCGVNKYPTKKEDNEKEVIKNRTLHNRKDENEKHNAETYKKKMNTNNKSEDRFSNSSNYFLYGMLAFCGTAFVVSICFFFVK